MLFSYIMNKITLKQTQENIFSRDVGEIFCNFIKGFLEDSIGFSRDHFLFFFQLSITVSIIFIHIVNIIRAHYILLYLDPIILLYGNIEIWIVYSNNLKMNQIDNGFLFISGLLGCFFSSLRRRTGDCRSR